MKRILSCIFILSMLAFVACDSGTKSAEKKIPTDTVKVTVASFQKQADTLIERHVIIEGTVLHTCKHGGKRMFLVDGNDSVSVEVTTGPTITKFDESLIGSRLRITGILKEERIDAKYLNDWENEVKKPQENHETGIHTSAKGHEDQGMNEKLEQIKELREELRKSGKDHLSNFSIEAGKYDEIK
jgi:hypothetical protein